ncbi:MAG: hypothetical protein H8E98_04665 [Bacteroidetes bacterium]|nr:hypothetical protein [Bacteroidota bacterium]
MTKNIVFNKISDLLQDIRNKNELLKSSEDDIHKIEVDIIKSKIRELYEAIGELENLDVDRVKTEEKIIVNEEPIHIESVEQISEEEAINEEPEEKIEIDEEEVPLEETAVAETVIEDEVVVETIEKPAEEPEPDSHRDKEEPKKKEEKLPPPETGDLFSNTTIGTIADKFKNTQQTLYDKFSDSKEDKSISSKMQKQHINDLKSAIGINEKFLFMNELFDGALSNYNDAINKLNEFGNLEDAIAYFKELETKYKWEDSIQSYSQLKSMIERKFN